MVHSPQAWQAKPTTHEGVADVSSLAYRTARVFRAGDAMSPCARGRGRVVNPPLRIGLVGAGWVTQHHLQGWKRIADDAQVVAIADPCAVRARERAHAFGIPAIFSDAGAMLAAGGLDAVDIAAPRAFHADLARLAASHGLPILCQKPLAPTLDEARRLIADIDGKVRLIAVGFGEAARPVTTVVAVLLSVGAINAYFAGGSRLGAASVALYLAEGAMGLPVFAGGATGLTAFAGPTAGYLLGFLPAAWIAGQASGSWLRGALVLTVAHLALFVPGVAWLAGFAGWEKALMAGFVLFIPGTLVKTGLAFAALRLARR